MDFNKIWHQINLLYKNLNTMQYTKIKIFKNIFYIFLQNRKDR